MKVHLIKKQSIEDYVQENARSKPSFAIWLSVAKSVVIDHLFPEQIDHP
jgi:mRNA interferase HigB